MGRALLKWSLDDLASAAGIHRNTLSNFETRKFQGDPNTRLAVRRALESAGVLLVDENGEDGPPLVRIVADF
ncbi:transcriptional regulator with XRE-family HTH domain [Bradyrhizobium sp. USDA 3240]